MNSSKLKTRPGALSVYFLLKSVPHCQILRVGDPYLTNSRRLSFRSFDDSASWRYIQGRQDEQKRGTSVIM